MERNRRPLRDLLPAPDERPRGVHAQAHRRGEHAQRDGQAHGRVLPGVRDGITSRRRQRVCLRLVQPLVQLRLVQPLVQPLVQRLIARYVRALKVPGDGAAYDFLNRRRRHPARVHRPEVAVGLTTSHHRTGQPVDLIVEHHLVLVSVHHGQDPLVGRDAVQRVGRVRRGVRPGLPRASHVHRHQPRADGSDEDGGVKPGQKRAFIRKVRLGLDAHRHRPRGLTGCPATGRWATAEPEPPS